MCACKTGSLVHCTDIWKSSILISLITIYACITPSLSQLNQYEEITISNITEEWRSTSDFVPVEYTSFGNITIRDEMSVEFDFVWWGRTADQRDGYAENFFRVGFPHWLGDSDDGECSNYPSFWLHQTTDTVYFVSSSDGNCKTRHYLDDYGIIVGTQYHFLLYFGSVELRVEITGGGRPDYPRTWARTPYSTYIGQTASVWFMSGRYSGTDYNRGNGTFSNIIIRSGELSTAPTTAPSNAPTSPPSITPSNAPSIAPSTSPSITPTQPPSTSPSVSPSISPSITPTQPPSSTPSLTPTNTPSQTPSNAPSNTPSFSPTQPPTNIPSNAPSNTPSFSPTNPSVSPTEFPTNNPSNMPSISPTEFPTNNPSQNATQNPTQNPSVSPTNPSQNPTISPSNAPSKMPSISPSTPTEIPTFNPSISPTNPSQNPSYAPSNPTNTPSEFPTVSPSNPTIEPTHFPSVSPSNPTQNPTFNPSISPTNPSQNPTISPSNNPTQIPSNTPSKMPSQKPTRPPSDSTNNPTVKPTESPTKTGQKKSQIKRKWFEGDCDFNCWQCMQKIDSITTDQTEEAYTMRFSSINDTECACPEQKAETDRENYQINIGEQNKEYFLQMRKSIQNNYTEYGLKVSIVTWERLSQDCNVSYYVNQNDFFGIFSQNILTITFTICNVSNTSLTNGAMMAIANNFTLAFAELFEINATQVNTSIKVGTYCFPYNDTNVPSMAPTLAPTEVNNVPIRNNRNGNDQQVTVVIVFSSTDDAMTASQQACEEAKEEIDSRIENCGVHIGPNQFIPPRNNTVGTELVIGGLSVTELIAVIGGAVVFLAIISVIICAYVIHSRKKKVEKKKLDLKYRKRTMSGATREGTIRGSVMSDGINTEGIEGHTKQTSEVLKPGLHPHNVSLKISENMIELALKELKGKDIQDTRDSTLNKLPLQSYKSLQSETNTLSKRYSYQSQDIQTLNIEIGIDQSSLKEKKSIEISPETLILSENIDNPYDYAYPTKQYKSQKEMIDDVILEHKANEISNDDLVIEQAIGNGQFGEVFKCTWEGNVVVVKHLKNLTSNDENENENETEERNNESAVIEVIDECVYENDNLETVENDENYEETIMPQNGPKISKKLSKSDERRLKEMRGEIILASSIPAHQNLVEIFGYTQGPFGIVMNYMKGGSVDKYVYRKYKSETDPIPSIMELLIILSKAAAGLKHLHSFGLMHRDIACRNILLGKLGNNNRIGPNTEVRITDFGLTRQLEHKSTSVQKTKSNFGPLKWMAPESIRLKEYSKKSDVYMFGITLWEIFYGMEPYINMLPVSVAMVVVTKGVRPPILYDREAYRYTDMPTKYHGLMKHCWEQKSTKRPGFAEIVRILNEIQANPTY